jgi:hypothetical protein
MSAALNFTEWTDAQLDATATPRMLAASPNSAPALLAEIQRRKDAGIWLTDGSTERVAAFAATVRKPRRRRSAR